MVASTPPAVSVIVPVYNEQDAISKLVAEIATALSATRHTFEIIVVDDGSTDLTAEVFAGLDDLVVCHHTTNRGQSAAVLTGIARARAPFVATLDGDGQDDPKYIPQLLAALANAEVAAAVRTNRADRAAKRLASRAAYLLRQPLWRDRVVDIGCGLRAFPRELALELPRFNGLHRLLPAVVGFMGGHIYQMPVVHRPRTTGVSKYTNWRRGLSGLLDLFGLWWLRRRLLPFAPSDKARWRQLAAQLFQK